MIFNISHKTSVTSDSLNVSFRNTLCKCSDCKTKLCQQTWNGNCLVVLCWSWWHALEFSAVNRCRCGYKWSILWSLLYLKSFFFLHKYIYIKCPSHKEVWGDFFLKMLCKHEKNILLFPWCAPRSRHCYWSGISLLMLGSIKTFPGKVWYDVSHQKIELKKKKKHKQNVCTPEKVCVSTGLKIRSHWSRCIHELLSFMF